MELNENHGLAHFYLVQNNLIQTLDALQGEIGSAKIVTHKEWHSIIIKYYDDGNRKKFFENWERYIPPLWKVGEYEKLEFFLNIYFTVHPVTNGRKDAWSQELKLFKEFLSTKGADFCKTNEFLPFYALPHIPNPSQHPTFQKYFTQTWMQELKSRVSNYLQSLANYKPQNNSQDLIRAKNHEEYLRAAIVEINSKWTNFAFNLLGISKQLLAHIGGMGEANLDLMKKKVIEYEKFLISSEDSVSNASSFIPVIHKDSLAPINYSAIKKELFSMNEQMKSCALLQALRWRLTRTSSSVRRSILEEYITHDILRINESGLSQLLQNGSPKLMDYLCKLSNVIASEVQGRAYLLKDNYLIPVFVGLMKKEEKDTILRQNIIGNLQKLSLRRRPQTIMIELKVIEWLVMVLSKYHELSEYSLEYSSALLVNLSLRTTGKDVCEQLDVLTLLASLIDHENPNIRTYINGTLYSILTRQSLKQKALKMGFDKVLRKLHETSEEAFKKQIYFILEQLKCEYEDSCYSDDEQDEEQENPDDESDQISDEEDIDELLDYSALLGEELLRQYQLGPESRASFYIPYSNDISSIEKNRPTHTPLEFSDLIQGCRPKSKIPRTPVLKN
jgi:LisH domain-containing protein ARMC9